MAPTSVMQYYMQDYGDAASILAEQWQDINDTMQWCEKFTTDHDLLKHDDESEDEYIMRHGDILETLNAQGEDDPEASVDFERYCESEIIYMGLYSVKYLGEWGNTLGDFFNPSGDDQYKNDIENYLPMAVSLSEGQRSALDMISLEALLNLGLTNEESVEEMLPDLEELLGDKDRISIYSGIDRGIFRGSVALTAEAAAQAADGYNPIGLFDFKGAVNILSYSVFLQVLPV